MVWNLTPALYAGKEREVCGWLGLLVITEEGKIVPSTNNCSLSFPRRGLG
jgi:hypothetical protein